MAPDAGDAIDPGTYLEPPLSDVPGTLALARALLDLAPAEPTPDVLPAWRKLQRSHDELHQAWAWQFRRDSVQVRPESRQPADFALDNAWTALYERLRAYALLPEEQVAAVRRSQELLRVLFPDALAFLRLPYEAEWAESEQRLKTVERLRLDADLAVLAGAEFLSEVRRTHEIYGKVLGMTRPSSEPPGDDMNLREMRWALARAIAHYALKVLASADDNPAEVRRLLGPIEEHHRRRSHAGAGAVK